MNRSTSRQDSQRNEHSEWRERIDWLALSRLVIFILALYSLGFYFGGLNFYYQRMLTPNDLAFAGTDLTTRQMQQAMDQFGLPLAYYAALNVFVMVVLGLGYGAVAILLLWFKPKDRMATFTALVLVLFGTGFPPVLQVMVDANPQFKPLMDAWSLAGFTMLFILYFVFPDGRFVPRWTVVVAVFWVVQNVVSVYWPGSPLLLFDYPEPWGSIAVFITLGLFVFAQVYRYLRVSDPVQRQQTKWVVIGLITAIVGFMIPWVARLIWPQLNEPTPLGLLADTLTGLLYLVSFVQIPITIGVAAGRYHLWDIDLLLRRTVVYTLLTISLAAIYLVVVVSLQFLLEKISRAGDSPAITVVSTLAIAALFNPLRRRIQNGIDRRFNRRKLDALRAMSDFHARTQTDVDIDTLTGALTQVVDEFIQPQNVMIWLKPENTSRSDSNAYHDHSVTISKHPAHTMDEG